MVFDFLKVLENTPIAPSGRELQEVCAKHPS